LAAFCSCSLGQTSRSSSSERTALSWSCAAMR
jgi:hypothetical protein